jgi:hypothetical protein
LEARTPFAVELLLGGYALRTDVIELRVEVDGFAGLGVFVLVIAGLRSVHRREGERVLHKLVAHLGELGVGLLGLRFHVLCREQ